MDLFLKLFSRSLQFFYFSFDRLVVLGCHRLLEHEAGVVVFFREVCGIERITREVLRARTDVYNRWVESYASNHGIPLLWAVQGQRKEEVVAKALAKMRREGRFGVYFILKSMERGPSFRCTEPKYPTDDPNYMILRKHRSRYTHYYFYIYDEVAGNFHLRIGSFLPFQARACLNAHEFIERRLLREGVGHTKADNAFSAVDEKETLQAAADAFDSESIQERIDYWTLIVGPKFSEHQRRAIGGLGRFWSVQQVEYSLNFIFKRSRQIRAAFQRCCELSLYLVTADRIGQIFGAQRKSRRVKGKLQNAMERVDEGLHVFRAYWKHSFVKQYHKGGRLLRMEVVCNNLKDFGLKKGLAHIGAVREKFGEVLGRFADAQAESLNVRGGVNLLTRLAEPVTAGKSKVVGIRLDQPRMIRLMELLLRRAGGGFGVWKTRELHRAMLGAYGLTAADYSLNALRYDLRKLRVHGIIERIGRTHSFRLTAKGQRTAALMTLLRRRVYGPLAESIIGHRPDSDHLPPSRFERCYEKVDRAMDQLMDLLAA